MNLRDMIQNDDFAGLLRRTALIHDHLQLETRLRDGYPGIEALYEPGFMLKDPKHKLMIKPQYLDDEDAKTIVDTIKAILKETKK